MNFFRNPEIKRDLLIYGVLWILGSLLGFWVDSMLGLGILLCGAVSGAYHFGATYQRYQRLRDLSQEIDRVLHGETRYSFGQYTEGELAILENELEKMLDERFYRVGRSALVNLTQIARVTKSEIRLLDGASIHLPRGAWEGVNRAIIRMR